MNTERRGAHQRAGDDRLPALAQRFGDALCAGDGRTADVVVREALRVRLAPAAVQARVIEPAMTRIGELWEGGAVSVADEHLATAIAQRSLIPLFEALRVIRPRSRERILLAAVEGQHHVLGLRMVADVLEGAGFDVMFLGADVPVESLREFCARHRPAVTGFAYGLPVHLELLADSISAVHDAAPESRIMFGGRAVPPVLEHLGYACVESSLEVVYTVERLLADPAPNVEPLLETLRATSVSPSPRSATRDDSLAARLATAAQDASEVARDYVRLAGTYRDLALTDPVTGLGNRRAFEERVTEPGDGTLLMIDLDNFKQVNDSHGHAAGDRLLWRVAHAITGCVRSDDFVGRVGGDEFAVVLRPGNGRLAHEVAERIRAAVAEIPDHAVSTSIGVAPLGVDRRAAQLAADMAMYGAKAAGRDRVMAAAAA